MGPHQVEDGRIGERAIGFEAVPFEQDGGRRSREKALLDLGDQPRLPDAGITGYHRRLTATADRLVDRSVEDLQGRRSSDKDRTDDRLHRPADHDDRLLALVRFVPSGSGGILHREETWDESAKGEP